jgi:putative SOS response-associated peptidase YedK
MSLMRSSRRLKSGFVIVTEDCEGGMVDIHDRSPVVLEPEAALRWLDPETPVEEAHVLRRQNPYPPTNSSGGRWIGQ